MSSIADPAARFSRQIVLAGVGVLGQRRLAAARYHFTGDPSLVEPAAAYVRAAGAANITTNEDGMVPPGMARCRVEPECGEHVRVAAVARPGDARVAVVASGAVDLPDRFVPSLMADAGDLAEAGMLLAIESLRAGTGETRIGSWGLGSGR